MKLESPKETVLGEVQIWVKLIRSVKSSRISPELARTKVTQVCRNKGKVCASSKFARVRCQRVRRSSVQGRQERS